MQAGANKTTIRDALGQWYPDRYSSVVAIRDNCSGPHCSTMCPDRIILGSPPSNIWSAHVKIVLLTIVVVIALSCLLAKGVFWLWLLNLNQKQKGYLAHLKQQMDEKDLEVELEFETCPIVVHVTNIDKEFFGTESI